MQNNHGHHNRIAALNTANHLHRPYVPFTPDEEVDFATLPEVVDEGGWEKDVVLRPIQNDNAALSAWLRTELEEADALGYTVGLGRVVTDQEACVRLFRKPDITGKVVS